MRIGDTVWNISYGHGTIIDLENADVYEVKFDNYCDVLVLSGVRLQKVED